MRILSSIKLKAGSFFAVVFLALLVVSPVASAATQTLDVVPITTLGAPSNVFVGAGNFDDIPGFQASAPVTVGPLINSANGGFDGAWQVPAAAAGCTRVLNSFTFTYEITGDESGDWGVAYGVSSDGMATINTTGSNGGAIIETVNFEGGPATYSETFTTPLPVDGNVYGIIGFESDDNDDGNDLMYEIQSVVFNVTDTCPDPDPVDPAPTVSEPSAPASPTASTESGKSLAATGNSTEVVILLALFLVSLGSLSVLKLRKSLR
jgi:hypothetical protein